MDDKQAAALRQPFPPSLVDKLEKSWRDRNGNTKSMSLDYVGHAHVTDRLLQVDPEWSWQPMATDTNGLPVLDSDGGLWIHLTIAGVTRPGYGWADGDTGGNAVKEAIGDAIRNAAMRFGVALDLWMKSPAAKSPAPTKTAAPAKTAAKPKAKVDPDERVATAFELVAIAGDKDALRAIWTEYTDVIDFEFNGTTLRGYIMQRQGEL
jgi:hypothetical protein